MKALLQRIYIGKIGLLSLIVILYLFAGVCFGSEGSSDWRKTYDLAMRWLNFLIFAGIFIKFGAKPLKSFTGQQRDEISIEILLLEKKKKELAADINQTLKMGEDSQAQFKNLKERILSEGKRRKKQIIEDAQFQSGLMIEEAKRKVEHRLLSARNNFHKELIDAATDLALEKLPQAVTKEDQEKRLDLFLKTIGAV